MNRRDFIHALGLATFASAACAEDEYPRRAIRLIVPYTPGTGIDILARSLGAKLGERVGVAVVVENRPGASGNIGTDAVAKSLPDGYTLLMTASTLVVNAGLFRHLAYDPVKDFAPVAPLALGSLALVTHPSVKAATVAELVALAKAAPGKLNYGSPGAGTPHHLAMELMKSEMGIDLVHVPYKGTGPAVTDLLGGQIQVMFLPVHVALPQVQSGKLRMLASGGIVRSSATPDMPTLAEAAGIRDIDVDIWYAAYAPAGTPREIVAKLNAQLNAILKLAPIREALAKQGLAVTGGTPEELARLTTQDLQRWSRVIRNARIEAE
jgi:tripartite-type tricarboxylate transporter receptor subunit TctC